MKKWNFHKAFRSLIIGAILFVVTVNVTVGQNPIDTFSPPKGTLASFIRLTNTAIVKNEVAAIETLKKAGLSLRQIQSLQTAISSRINTVASERGMVVVPQAIFTSDAYPSDCDVGVAYFDIWASTEVQMTWHFLGASSQTDTDICPDTFGCFYVHPGYATLGKPFRYFVSSYSIIGPHWANCSF